jgi:hypothetical protein
MTPEERKQKFLDGYKELREETQIDIFFMPQFIPDGKGNFTVKVLQNLVDLKDQGMPSDESMFL